MSLIAKIRSAKTVAGVNRLINPVIKRRPLNRGAATIAQQRIRELTAEGKLGSTRKTAKVTAGDESGEE